MIVLSAPLMQKNIIELLEAQDGAYKFMEKKGLQLIFETTLDDEPAAAKKAKELIKATPWGSGLYFQAEAK